MHAIYSFLGITTTPKVLWFSPVPWNHEQTAEVGHCYKVDLWSSQAEQEGEGNREMKRDMGKKTYFFNYMENA